MNREFKPEVINDEQHSAPLSDLPGDLKETLKTENLQNQLERAISIISQPHFDILTQSEDAEMQSNLLKISEDKITHPSPEVQELLKNKDIVVPFQRIFGLTNNALFSIYKIGFYYFQNQKYEEATDIFTFLVALNPTVADFCTALGLCLQQKEKWDEALTFFTLASNLNADHIAAHISAINCYTKFGNKEGARIHLNAIENICSQRPEVAAPWKEIIEFYKSQIQ